MSLTTSGSSTPWWYTRRVNQYINDMSNNLRDFSYGPKRSMYQFHHRGNPAMINRKPTAKRASQIRGKRNAVPRALRSNDTMRHCQAIGFKHAEIFSALQTLKALRIRMPDAKYLVDGAIASQKPGQRSSSVIHCKGIKQHYIWENRTQFPFMLHYALCQVKEEKADINNLTELRKGFFRDNTFSSDKEIDFTDAPLSSDFYQMYLEHYSINPDRFNILFHKKVTLDPSIRKDDVVPGEDNEITGPRPIRESPGVHRFKYYQKINQQITFNDSSDLNVRPFLMFFWITPMYPSQWVNGAADAQSQSVNCRGYDTVYYTD